MDKEMMENLISLFKRTGNHIFKTPVNIYLIIPVKKKYLFKKYDKDTGALKGEYEYLVSEEERRAKQ